MSQAQDTYLTTQEIATQMHVKRSTVHRLIQRKALPATQFGRSWRVKGADLEAYLREHSNQQPAAAEGERV